MKAKGLLSLMLSLPDNWDYYHPDFHVYESGPVRFSMELDRLDKRPYGCRSIRKTAKMP